MRSRGNRLLSEAKIDINVSDGAKTTIALEEHVAPGGFGGFISKFTVIFGARRELWLTFLIKLLIYTAYSITNKTMILWLSKDLGFSDQAAGALVGWVWAPAMTVFTLLAGAQTSGLSIGWAAQPCSRAASASPELTCSTATVTHGEALLPEEPL